MKRRRWSERGQAAGVETIPFGILVFVSGVLIVLNAWAVTDTRAAVDTAARDYLRAYTAAPTSAAGRAEGDAAARRSLAARAGTATAARVTDPSEPFGPCRPATVTIALDVPAVRIPFVGAIGSHTVSATQTELVQPYADAHDEGDGGSPCDG